DKGPALQALARAKVKAREACVGDALDDDALPGSFGQLEGRAGRSFDADSLEPLGVLQGDGFLVSGRVEEPESRPGGSVVQGGAEGVAVLKAAVILRYFPPLSGLGEMVSSLAPAGIRQVRPQSHGSTPSGGRAPT